MDELRFDGQVAIVTGAGRGIGSAHARLLAARGAMVVVNDVGSAMSGSGCDQTPADQTVATIRKEGGVAEADYTDIADPDGARRLVEHAREAFGPPSIVVNNAGIYATDSFPEVTLGDVWRQLEVHLGGSFNVTRAAWPAMAAAGYGRIVVTTSTGALGSETLTAYGTAKAAVLGLGRALAMSGAPLGIRVNIVAPMAMTRMMAATELHGEDPPSDRDRDPGMVSPLVALLCHESCPTNGETFLSGMRRYARLFIGEAEGYVHRDSDVTIEDVVEHWATISDLTHQHVVPDTASWVERHIAHVGLSLPGN
jgi:NAD(P)-dependent dehydrogenase (short-subunit alcohol dehydrogenase family)